MTIGMRVGGKVHAPARRRSVSARRLFCRVGLLSMVVVTACASPAGTITVSVVVVAGPVCAVVTDPPDPACADRPVEGAELVVVDRNGRTVVTARSDTAGRVSLALEPGSYVVRPKPVAGLIGTPDEIPLVVDRSTAPLTIGYDTGIR